jgi:hypothetical protein
MRAVRGTEVVHIAPGAHEEAVILASLEGAADPRAVRRLHVVTHGRIMWVDGPG